MVITSNLILLNKKADEIDFSIFPCYGNIKKEKEIDKISKFLVNRTNYKLGKMK